MSMIVHTLYIYTNLFQFVLHELIFLLNLLSPFFVTCHIGSIIPSIQQETACSNCFEDIEIGSVAVVANRFDSSNVWHPSCFKCCIDGELLVDMIYFCWDNRLYCGRHHGELFKPRCYGCEEVTQCFLKKRKRILDKMNPKSDKSDSVPLQVSCMIKSKMNCENFSLNSFLGFKVCLRCLFMRRSFYQGLNLCL